MSKLSICRKEIKFNPTHTTWDDARATRVTVMSPHPPRLPFLSKVLGCGEQVFHVDFAVTVYVQVRVILGLAAFTAESFGHSEDVFDVDFSVGVNARARTFDLSTFHILSESA